MCAGYTGGGNWQVCVDNWCREGAAEPPGGFFNAERPIVCEVEGALEGVEVVGAHEEQVTDLAVPSFVSSHVASASQDGTVSQALSICSWPFLALFC
jgi:hypothetical protein